MLGVTSLLVRLRRLLGIVSTLPAIVLTVASGGRACSERNVTQPKIMRKTGGKYLGADSTGRGLCSGCSSRGLTWWEARREENALAAVTALGDFGSFISRSAKRTPGLCTKRYSTRPVENRPSRRQPSSIPLAPPGSETPLGTLKSRARHPPRETYGAGHLESTTF